MDYLISGRIPIDQHTSYACGWCRAQLPSKLSQTSINSNLFPPDGMPVVGKEIPSQLVLLHHGNLPGAMCMVILLPATDTFITVLSNSQAICDVADLVGQLVLEEVLEVPREHRVDFVQVARDAVANNLQRDRDLAKKLADARRVSRAARHYSGYVGTYWNSLIDFGIEVTWDYQDESLYWGPAGIALEKIKLDHYENDTFTWLRPRNELSRSGRWVGGDEEQVFWKIEFIDNDGRIEQLC